jgi:hypothetical protein
VWRRIGAVGGVLYVLLQLLGILFLQSGQTEPAFTAPGEEILSYLQSRGPTELEIQGYATVLALLAFVWFLGGLWSTLRIGHANGRILAWVAAGSGLMSLMVLTVPQTALLQEDLDAQVARLIFVQASYSFVTTWALLGNMLLASGIAGLLHGALPRWLAWLGVLDGLALLVARAFWTSGPAILAFLLFWVWVVAVSITMWRGRTIQDQRIGA